MPTANVLAPTPAPIAWSASLRLIPYLAAFKVLTLLLAYCSLVLIPMPFNIQSYHSNYHWPPDAPLTIRSAYQTWDAQQYLAISQRGYDQASLRNMHPLWPAVVHFTGILCGDPLVASLIAANLFAVAGLVLLHRLTALTNDLASADAAVLLALAFPSAFFMSLPYSESLFFLLVVGLFLALQTDSSIWIWTMAALLPLTRAVGVVCLCPIIVDQCLKRRPLRAAVLSTGTLAGVLVYFLTFKIMTGDALSGLHTTFTSTRASTANLLHPIQFLGIFFSSNIELHGILNSAIDRGIFILVLASLWPMLRRDLAQAAYTVPAAIIPAMSQSMMSFTRFASVLFPVYIVGGRLLSPPSRKWCLWLIVAACGSLQVIFIIRHVHWDWVG